MDQKNPSSSSTRKLKFTPKAPKRRPPTSSSQPARNAADEDAESEFLLSQFQMNTFKLFSMRRLRPKYNAQGMILTRRNVSIVICESDKTTSLDVTMEDVLHDSSSEDETYLEPWDCGHINYPTTLPIREPDSGNPKILNEAEFGEAATNKEYNEKNVNAAEKLGLLDENEKESLLLFKFPNQLPLQKESVSSNSKGKESGGQAAAGASHKFSDWGDLTEGRMGKLVVYKSGTVKLKLGETLFDVYPGAGDDCEQVMAMNVGTKDCCHLGQVEKHVVVSPDVDSILDGSTLE
ncbi:hypothetical protein V2J09_012998 [Rumex salicifolius]